ncbi:hypothetical protein WJX82_008099 [Trebouxia sp. C0006]
MDGHVARPAHLKISTSDKRAVEVKIVYAVNPNMPTQLYEVDVFMFFLKDLEAVSNNFYHDLWQVARLHTPKIPLAMLANDSSAGFTDLIGRELLAIESKKAAGDTASVQQEVDGIVQQLRLHVCIFRNAIRRALKGISEALDRLEGSQAGAADTLQACRAVTTVVGQIAKSVHRLQQVCLPCEAADAPDAVNVFPASDQSGLAILNGGSDGMSSAAGSIFVNPLVSIGLEAGQDKGRNCADTSGMLGLIQKIQAVQGVADSVDLDKHDNMAGEIEASMQVAADARQLIMETVIHLQDERRRRGYHESIIVPNDPGRNEQYTNRIKCLKHNARAAVVLRPQLLAQSFLLADLVGMTIAGAAMCLATGAVFVATRFSRNQLSGVYVTIIVVGYMLKDRMKEWGKRYLQPAAMKFGFEFPDRTVKMRDSRGKRVGRCKEWVKVVSDTEVDVRVLAMRHKDKGHIPPERQALKPERVLAYRKKMEVAWNQLDPRLRGVDGLDDIMRFDLQHFCRRMQPPDEPHYSLETGEDGSMQVQKIQCARVYHINVVLRIRTSVQDTRKDKAYKEKSLQIQRARIIMDQSGIKRLEATDDSVHLSADRHAVSPGPVWRPDVHMSAMHLPIMSMLRMPTFGRHSAVPAADEANNRDTTMLPEVRSDVKNPAKELVEAV